MHARQRKCGLIPLGVPCPLHPFQLMFPGMSLGVAGGRQATGVHARRRERGQLPGAAPQPAAHAGNLRHGLNRTQPDDWILSDRPCDAGSIGGGRRASRAAPRPIAQHSRPRARKWPKCFVLLRPTNCAMTSEAATHIRNSTPAGRASHSVLCQVQVLQGGNKRGAAQHAYDDCILAVACEHCSQPSRAATRFKRCRVHSGGSCRGTT